MQYTTDKLTQPYSWSVFKSSRNHKICGTTLRELFDIPSKVREVWITISDKEIEHSMPYELGQDYPNPAGKEDVQLTLLDGSLYARCLYLSFRKWVYERIPKGYFIVQYEMEE
ncbi:MAG: hypothetical protein FVQ79_00190 [Planctomycetes bacterium]|nr:hypothetical protein [Planctomycetota bacterium]